MKKRWIWKVLIICVICMFATGWEGKKPPIGKYPDELEPLPQAGEMVETDPHQIRAGEGFALKVKAPQARAVSATFPAPDGSGGWMTVNLVQNGNKEWILPEAILEADGSVRYEGVLGNAVKGERKIYTPFLWPHESFPVKMNIDGAEQQLEVKVSGSLLNRLVYRPIDPRNPFPFGVSPAWENHLHLFEGSGGS